MELLQRLTGTGSSATAAAAAACKPGVPSHELEERWALYKKTAASQKPPVLVAISREATAALEGGSCATPLTAEICVEAAAQTARTLDRAAAGGAHATVAAFADSLPLLQCVRAVLSTKQKQQQQQKPRSVLANVEEQVYSTGVCLSIVRDITQLVAAPSAPAPHKTQEREQEVPAAAVDAMAAALDVLAALAASPQVLLQRLVRSNELHGVLCLATAAFAAQRLRPLHAKAVELAHVVVQTPGAAAALASYQHSHGTLRAMLRAFRTTTTTTTAKASAQETASTAELLISWLCHSRCQPACRVLFDDFGQDDEGYNALLGALLRLEEGGSGSDAESDAEAETEDERTAAACRVLSLFLNLAHAAPGPLALSVPPLPHGALANRAVVDAYQAHAATAADSEALCVNRGALRVLLAFYERCATQTCRCCAVHQAQLVCTATPIGYVLLQDLAPLGFFATHLGGAPPPVRSALLEFARAVAAIGCVPYRDLKDVAGVLACPTTSHEDLATCLGVVCALAEGQAPLFLDAMRESKVLDALAGRLLAAAGVGEPAAPLPERLGTDTELLPYRLRYFTPREVARLHCFPDSFVFPTTMTARQIYRVLGLPARTPLKNERRGVMLSFFKLCSCWLVGVCSMAGNSLNCVVLSHVMQYLFGSD